MIKYVFLLLLCFNVSAYEYEISVGKSEVVHAWRGTNNVSNYDFTATTISLNYLHDYLGVGLSYAKADDYGYTKGRYERLRLEMDNITSIEAFYHNDFYKLNYKIGVSFNYIPASVRDPITGYYDKDRDDDKGYFIAFSYPIYKNISLTYKYASHSRITVDPYDEWTRSNSLFITYRF